MRKIYTLFLSTVMTTLCFTQTPEEGLSFDGTNDYVSAALPTLFNDIANNDFTIETWIKPTASQTQRVFFAQLNTGEFVSILLNTSNVPYFYVYNGGANGINSSGSLTNGQWHHIAFTWEAATQTSNIYIDGVIQNAGAPGGSSTGSNNIMTIGARSDGSQTLSGELDEFRIWDYAKNICEINGAMNSEFTNAQTNLIAYYNFNQGTPGGNNAGIITLPDFTTNYDGTLQNFALSGATSNWISSNANITQTNQNVGFVSSTDVQVACESFTWINGTTYTQSNNTATHTFPGGSVNGCDSIVNLDLTINNSVTGTDIQAACDTYTWIDGNTYTVSNNTATHTIVGGASNGCDSIVTLDLTINNSTTGTDTQTACDNFTWIDGNTYTVSNNTATHTISGGASNGCDSTVTLNLTINNSTTGTDTQTACGEFTWIDGNTYTQNNNSATFTITGGASNGCDSIVTLNLTFDLPDVSVTNNDPTLEAVSNGSFQYQWLDCNDNYAIISGANSSSFTPTSNGSYAVEINNGSCVDTSSCEMVAVLSNIEYSNGAFLLYPNPSNGNFTLRVPQNGNLKVYSIHGQLVYSSNIDKGESHHDMSLLGAGIYTVKFNSSHGNQVKKMIIK